jgi:hypothetical protein
MSAQAVERLSPGSGRAIGSCFGRHIAPAQRQSESRIATLSQAGQDTQEKEDKYYK